VDIAHPALRPPSAHGFLASANEASMPSLFLLPLSAWKLPSLEVGGATRSPPLTGVGPDWSMAVWTVLSLAVALLGYDRLCGRQLIRVVQMAASGARSFELLAQRASALWVSAAVPFGLGAGLAGVLVALRRGLSPLLDVMPETLAFSILALAGTALFTVATLLVSVWRNDPTQVLVTLVLIWVGSVVVIPSSAAILATRLEPVPSELEVARQLEQIGFSVNEVDGSSDWRPWSWAEVDGFAAERHSARIQSERYELQADLIHSHVERRLARAEAARQGSYLSPVALLEDLGERLLGAGIYRQQELLEQVAGFEERLRSWAAREDLSDSRSPHLHFFPGYMSRQHPDPGEVPRFAFEEPGLARGVRLALPQLALLFGVSIVLGCLLLWAFAIRLENPTELEGT
ncbi:MAG: hypothetical protein MI919_01230, partial [Holophagales bacterium]|nr:hypothetical protein [Holophagales bacterium]